MAMTQRATTPRADTIPPIDRAPSTPTSLPATSASIITAKGASPARLAPASNTRSISPKTTYAALSPRSSPQPFTGAAALADARRARQQKEARLEDRQTSPNPKVLALNALMGTQDVSKPSDAPPTSQMSEALKSTAEKLTVPVTNGSNVAKPKTNGTNGDVGSGERHDSSAMTATAMPEQQNESQLVEEPESMDDNGNDNAETQEEGGTRPFTYPGPMPSHQQDTPSRRDLSYDSGSKSSTKRHKCPYCSTDFTRHHNLKSHLLTHSQEKPYVCPTCSARFRRLHDLKRHTKLHTGERPHTCPKCGRKFARGDALARHNKGPGGCANRKSSFGQDDGDDGGDDTMDGLEYENDQGDDRDEDSEMLDPAGRRVSEPNRKRPRPDSSMDSTSGPYRQQSSTYPPPPQMARISRHDGAPMGPPQSLLSPGSRPSPPEHGHVPLHHNDHHHQPQYYPQPTGSSYPPPQVTESPRPLSPRTHDQQRLSVSDPQGLRNRSPSLNSSYQSPQYGRRSIPGMPPQAHMATHGPQLPSLGSLASSHHPVQPPALVAPSYPPLHHPPSHPVSGGGLTNSNPGSHSSHGHSSSGSIREIIGSETQDLMAYVRNLETRFSRMQDEYELRISRLQADVIELKNQMHSKGRA